MESIGGNSDNDVYTNPYDAIQGTAPAQSSGLPLHMLAEITSYLLLFLLIFGMSATVDINSLVAQLTNKMALLTGVGMQFLIMPFLGYISVYLLKDHGLTTSMGITLLIVTSSPGGSYSNWWCSTFNADLALSVTMTALSTLLSVMFLPANLMLYSHAAYGFGDKNDILSKVDFKSLFISIAVVISAICLGFLASYKFHDPKFHRWSNRLGSISGVLLIIFSAVISTGSQGDDAALWEQDWPFFLGVSIPCVFGLIIANIFTYLAGLRKPEVVTLSVECCYQNVGIATSAAMAMFDKPQERAQAICVPLLYGIIEAGLLAIYCVFAWKLGWTKAPKDENFCVMISKTYEVSDETDTSVPTSSSEDSAERAIIDQCSPSDRDTYQPPELEDNSLLVENSFQQTKIDDSPSTGWINRFVRIISFGMLGRKNCFPREHDDEADEEKFGNFDVSVQGTLVKKFFSPSDARGRANSADTTIAASTDTMSESTSMERPRFSSEDWAPESLTQPDPQHSPQETCSKSPRRAVRDESPESDLPRTP